MDHPARPRKRAIPRPPRIKLATRHKENPLCGAVTQIKPTSTGIAE